MKINIDLKIQFGNYRRLGNEEMVQNTDPKSGLPPKFKECNYMKISGTTFGLIGLWKVQFFQDMLISFISEVDFKIF